MDYLLIMVRMRQESLSEIRLLNFISLLNKKKIIKSHPNFYSFSRQIQLQGDFKITDTRLSVADNPFTS